MTFGPLVVPFESVPALVVKKMLAPAALPPDCPGFSVTVRGIGRVEPPLALWPPPLVAEKLAAGLPTTIHPPCDCETVPSLPVTVKWQKPGVVPASTVIVPGSVGVMVELVSVIDPPQAEVPSNLSNVADPRVTFVVPLTILGWRVTAPPGGTMIVSGLRSHSDAGVFVELPVITNSVAEYGPKFMVEFHDCCDDAVIVDDEVDENE